MHSAGARWTLCGLFAVYVGAILFGAWTGFPVYDDAYLVGFIRELGAGSIAPDHPDRPLYGLFMQSLAAAFGLSRAPYIVIGIGSWMILAWQTMRLWQRIFPEESDSAPLPALLVLSPLLVKTQYTTVTAVIPGNLPVCLCLAAVLVSLRDEEGERHLLWLSAGLALAAAVLSEYGVATMAASVPLLLLLRRFRSAGSVFAGGVVGYAVFRMISNVQAYRPVDPSVFLPRVLQHPSSAVGHWITDIWHCLFGAWFAAAGAIRVAFDSRSTLLAAAAGLLSAAAIVRTLRGPLSSAKAEWQMGRLVALSMAVASGLLPAALAGRSTEESGFNSRVCTPVVVFAAVAVAGFACRITARRFRPVVFGFLAFLAGYWVVADAFSARRQQEFYEGLGTRLLPLVRNSPGVTVAVLPGYVGGDDLTPKVTFRWSDEEARRAWVLRPHKAVEQFGPRVSCHDTDRIATPPVLHSTGRRGPVSHLVWVPVTNGLAGDLEPYCIEPGLRDGVTGGQGAALEGSAVRRGGGD